MAIRVLVVDDVPDLREMFREVLSSDDRLVVVGEAADGLEAIAKASELHPDVILLDVAMPRLDGLRAIPLLHEASPGTRILILSAFTSDEIAAFGMEVNPTGFIEKGIPPYEIADVIVKMMRLPAIPGRNAQPV